ncbi:MAG: hypothetical protein F4X44_05990 [Gammaproteobacteria bacterium]|nr:hypothetical protein [Gammaproteobacteria bacterium]MYD80143.1 hypothetical protein [Gammaproteobacteria bacterium]
MQLAKLVGFTFPVPFKVVFRHASASRRRAENFVVCVTTDSGVVGFGEGCPRSYVTGESIESCTRFLLNHQSSLENLVVDLRTLKQWIETNKHEIDANPSAFCAIEMAILDALGKEESKAIEALLGLPHESGVVHYTAVLGDAPYAAYWWMSRLYIRNGFSDIKIKLSGDSLRDRRKLQLWQRRITDGLRVRLDANNLWTNWEECIEYLRLLPQVFWGIEEPLQPRDYFGMQQIGSRLGIKLILDESCTRVEDLDNVCGISWVLNLRVSKVGGILRAIELAHLAQQNDLGIIVGAHVGETSLLTRGTLVVLQFLRNRQVAVEGAFGRHLLSADLSDEVIEFDANANIDLDSLYVLRNPGSGLHVDKSKLQSL